MRTLIALLALSSSLSALAENAVPETLAQWLGRMTDFTQNTLPAPDPQAFIGFMNAVTEPAFQQARIDKLTEPALWSKVVHTANSPGAVQNMEALATPQTAMNWASALMDPRFHEAMMAILSDPGKQIRWAMAPMDPTSWQPLEKLASPALYERWEQATVQPATGWVMPLAATAGNQAAAPAAAMFFPLSMMPR